jgi:small subunit ribosomal protein S2
MFRKLSVYRKILVIFIIGGGYYLINDYLKKIEKPSEDLKIISKPITISKRENSKITSQLSMKSTKDLGRKSKNTASRADELTRIDGIGPKTASALLDAGVRTFGQLAKLNEESIKDLLLSGGARVVNINNWATQAKFAENSDWDGLNKYLKTLK